MNCREQAAADVDVENPVVDLAAGQRHPRVLRADEPRPVVVAALCVIAAEVKDPRAGRVCALEERGVDAGTDLDRDAVDGVGRTAGIPGGVDRQQDPPRVVVESRQIDQRLSKTRQRVRRAVAASAARPDGVGEGDRGGASDEQRRQHDRVTEAREHVYFFPRRRALPAAQRRPVPKSAIEPGSGTGWISSTWTTMSE